MTKTYINVYFNGGVLKDSHASSEVADYSISTGGVLTVQLIKGGTVTYGPAWSWRVTVKAAE